MLATFELEMFSDWLSLSQNEEAVGLLLALSVAPAARNLGVDHEDVLDMLEGDDRIDFTLMHMDNCAASGAAENVPSLGQIYLKKRGWKDSALNRAYIEALCASRFQLLKVVEVSGDTLHVASALADGETIEAEAPEDMLLSPGDLVATRILNVRGKTRLATGLFVFNGEALDHIVAYLQDARARLVEAPASPDAAKSIPEKLDMFLALVPYAMVAYWLEEIAAQPDISDIKHIASAFEGDYWRTAYSLADGVDEAQFAAAVSALPGLVPASPGRWRCAELDVEDASPNRVSRMPYAIVFNDRRLRVYAATENVRDLLRDRFGELEARFFAGPVLSDELSGMAMAKDLVQHLALQPAA